MITHVGGIGIFPGSFNPPHIGHIMKIRLALECFDTLHIFVRYNESVELVDWETKRGWFDRINEEVGGHLVIHKHVNQNVTGKTYTLEDFFDFIREAVCSVGEPVAGYVAGDDYREIMPALEKEFPELYFFQEARSVVDGMDISSSAIREDLEGHRAWLPDYVYETLERMEEQASGAKTGCINKEYV